MILGTLLIVWSVVTLLTLLSHLWVREHLKEPPPYTDAPFNLYPISILKPIKGLEPDLYRNLESYFELRYPNYEIIFCLADGNDPARPIIERLLSEYPRTNARLLIEPRDVGCNPKINNLISGFEKAQNDWIVISDSNIRVKPNFLKKLVAHLDSQTGVLTALVTGTDENTWAGRLEASFLNTFYFKWMVIASRFNRTCVLGKTMVFRRSVANRFGGMNSLAKYIAEDYMAGESMRQLGMKVVLMHEPVEQPLKNYSASQFLNRHVRWGRIRRAHTPWLYLIEPLGSALVPAVVGALSLPLIVQINPEEAFLGQMSLALLLDSLLVRKVTGTWSARFLAAWLLRELLVLPLWLYSLSSRVIDWRGQKLRLTRGGIGVAYQPNRPVM